MRRTTLSLAAPAALACLLAAAPVQAQDAPTLSLEPAVIEMGPFYGGARLRIAGMVPPGSQVAVAIRGPEVEELFNKKGRVGPIWVNEGKVHVSGVPSLFLCFSSAPLGTILSRRALDDNQLDEEAILAQMVVQPKAMDQSLIRSNYLSLKAQQGTFRVAEGQVRLEEPGPASSPSFGLDVPWPKRAPPASYEVVVYACRGGEVTGKASARLQVREVGFPLTLASLAKDRAALYGTLCVLLAMLAGFGIDFLMTKLGKRGPVSH